MAVSRRNFIAARVSPFAPALIAARGLEAEPWQAAQAIGRSSVSGAPEIRINSNENPLGPGASVIDAMLGKCPEAGRYPFNSTPDERALTRAIADMFRVKTESVVVGAGSQELLKSAVRAFTSRERGLVTGFPSFENCPSTARRLGHPVVQVNVDAAFRLDLDAMADACRGAGLVFLNNPNNPTATVHSGQAVAAFVSRVHRTSPDTTILIDEAYHDYVTDPAYQTAVPLALETPHVFVTRTFSKAYGMAGMRVGYAIGRPDTLTPLARLAMPYNVSVFGIAGAIAALHNGTHIAAERARNTRVRTFTTDALAGLGCRMTESQANFLFVDVGRPAKLFRDECARRGVLVGRDFPPFEKTHARISIGTIEEMQRAVPIFREVLHAATTAATGQPGEESWR